MKRRVEFNTYNTGFWASLILVEVGSWTLFYFIIAVIFLILMILTKIEK